jgi:hypothetical protein
MAIRTDTKTTPGAQNGVPGVCPKRDRPRVEPYPQHMVALAKANAYRIARARDLRRLKAGEIKFSELDLPPTTCVPSLSCGSCPTCPGGRTGSKSDRGTGSIRPPRAPGSCWPKWASPSTSPSRGCPRPGALLGLGQSELELVALPPAGDEQGLTDKARRAHSGSLCVGQRSATSRRSSSRRLFPVEVRRQDAARSTASSKGPEGRTLRWLSPVGLGKSTVALPAGRTFFLPVGLNRSRVPCVDFPDSRGGN